MEFQAEQPLAREGLPYWILWFLLCVILLLLAFIFLRDRDLRHKLNEFLSGAKKRVKRAQLRIRLNREKRRKNDLLGELGKTAWTGQIPHEKYQPFFQHLEQLDRQRAERQAELKSILSLILDLQRGLDDARQEKKRILKLKEDGQHSDVHGLHDTREKEKRLRREIKDGERKIQTGREALRAIDWQKEEQFLRLGTLIDELRPDHKDFLGGFVQIDKLNRKILHYMNEIEKFR